MTVGGGLGRAPISIGAIVVLVVLTVLFTVVGCSRQLGFVSTPFGLDLDNGSGKRIASVLVRLEDGRTYESGGIEIRRSRLLPIAFGGKTKLRLHVAYCDGKAVDYSVMAGDSIVHVVRVWIHKDRATSSDGFVPPATRDSWEVPQIRNNTTGTVRYVVTFDDGRSFAGDVPENEMRVPALAEEYGYRRGRLRANLEFADGTKVSHLLTLNLDQDEPICLIIEKDKSMHVWRKTEVTPRGSWEKAVSRLKKEEWGE